MKRPPRPNRRLRRVTTVALMASALLAPTTAHASGGGGTEDEDVVPPVVTVAPLPDPGWHSSPTTYRIRAIDEGPLATGVSFVHYRLTGATSGTGQLDRISGGDLTISNDGTTRIEVEAVDGNGNPGYADFLVRVDRTAPLVTFTSPQPGPTPVTIPLGGQTRLHYACSDPGAGDTSGVAACAGDIASGAVLPAGAPGEFVVNVTARDNAGNVTVRPFTYRVSSAIATLTRPAITGTPKLGSLLSGTPGTYSPQPDTTTCRWQRDGVDIASATTSTYAVAQVDLGHDLTYECTVALAGFPNLTVDSTTMQVPLEPMPELIRNVRVAGPGWVGETLSAEWEVRQIPAAAQGVLFTVRWLRDGTIISGAAGRTYVVAPADHGHQITAVAHAEWDGHVPTDYPASNAIAIHGLRAFEASGTPTVHGTATVGKVLTATLPEVRPFGPAPPTSFTLATAWLRDGQPIAGESGSTYLLRAADAGHRISVRLTASGPGFATTEWASTATAAVGPGTPSPQASAQITARAKALGHRAVRLKVQVAANQAPATGEIVVRRGRKVVGHGVLSNGRVLIKLRKQPAGTARYLITYPGSTGVTPAQVRIRVRVR